MIKDTIFALAQKNITLTLSNEAKEFILEKGTDLKYGARPLRRAIQRYIEDEISEKILRGQIVNGQNVNIILEDNKLKFIN